MIYLIALPIRILENVIVKDCIAEQEILVSWVVSV
jgi:hypothetical protein